jgi:hypothetical protein
MNKALENNYIIDNKNKNNTENNNKKKKKQKNENNNNNLTNNVNIKYGFCNLSLFEQFENVSYISLIESDNGKVIWDTSKQNKDDYCTVEKNIINNFKNIFFNY